MTDNKYTKGKNQRFREQGRWLYWIDESHMAATETDGYWDQIAGDFDADNPYFEAGQHFTVNAGVPGNFHQAEFVLVGLRKVLIRQPTFTNDGVPMAGDYRKRPVVRRITEWMFFSYDAASPARPEEKKPEYIKTDGILRWNPGKKVHQVIVDDKVVFESADKNEAEAVRLGNQPIAA